MGRVADYVKRGLFGGPVERDIVINPPALLEGTRMSLWNSILPNIYADFDGSGPFGDASLAEKVWVTSVCQDLNASQIAGMRIQWHGPPGVDQPAWVSSPDPAQFPAGIGDALYAINDQIDGWGYSIQYVTDFYSSGYPRRFTVVPSSACKPYFDSSGRKVYKVGDRVLDNARVVQIDRNPTTAAHGTSAIRAFAQAAYGLLGAQNQSQSVTSGGIPQAVLKSENRLTAEQAVAAQDQWVARTAARNGAPPVLGQGWDFKQLSINPADLSLLETQEWNARILAAAYGVPAILLNIALTGGLVYQNPEQLMRAWWLTRLRTRSKRIMDAFSAQMLPAGQSVTQDASDITVEGSVEAEDDPQLSPAAKASPAQQPSAGLTAIGGGRV